MNKFNRFFLFGCMFFVSVMFVVLGTISYYTQTTTGNIKHIKLEKYEARDFKLVNLDPPKHVYVDIEDIKTGEIISHVYVSKHCNNWREKAVIGKVYRIVVATYRDDRNNTRSIEYKDLHEVFCP